MRKTMLFRSSVERTPVTQTRLPAALTEIAGRIDDGVM